MAIIQNVVLRGARKRLGSMVTYQRDGYTIVRELPTNVANPRTTAQMSQRIKLANLVNFFKANKDWMKKAYEGKIALRSDYNRFTSINLTNSPVALTKDEANLGSAVVAPYMISKGSLPSIQLQKVGNYWTGPALHDVPAGGITTIGQLASCLVGGQWHYGDQLSFIRLTQQTNDVTGTPYIQVRAYELILKRGSNELITKYMPAELFSIQTIAGVGDFVAIFDNGNDGGFALIQSRTKNGRVYVSTQNIQMVGTSTLEQYSTDEQIYSAIESYGAGDSIFLDSKTAEADESAGTQVSLSSVRYNGTTYYQGGLPFTTSGNSFSNMVVAFTTEAPEPATQNPLQGFTGLTQNLTATNVVKNGNTWVVAGTNTASRLIDRVVVRTSEGITFTLMLTKDSGNLDD